MYKDVFQRYPEPGRGSPGLRSQSGRGSPGLTRSMSSMTLADNPHIHFLSQDEVLCIITVNEMPPLNILDTSILLGINQGTEQPVRGEYFALTITDSILL